MQRHEAAHRTKNKPFIGHTKRGNREHSNGGKNGDHKNSKSKGLEGKAPLQVPGEDCFTRNVATSKAGKNTNEKHLQDTGTFSHQ